MDHLVLTIWIPVSPRKPGRITPRHVCGEISKCLLIPVKHIHCFLQILGYFDYAFTAIFTVEIILKVIGMFRVCVFCAMCRVSNTVNHLVAFQVLGYADYVFTSMFTFEIVLKVTPLRTQRALLPLSPCVSPTTATWLDWFASFYFSYFAFFCSTLLPKQTAPLLNTSNLSISTS